MLVMAAPIDPRAKLIQTLLDRHRLSYRWLGERMGKPHVTIASWIRGDNAPRDRNVFNTMLEHLAVFGKSQEGSSDIAVVRAGVRQIPVYPDLEAGLMASSEADVTMMNVMDWNNGNERWGRKIRGFSMFPVLEPGDVVVFEGRPWEPNHVVHAFDDGKDTVKVARGYGLKYDLWPVNPEFPVIPGTHMNIKGVAVERIRKGINDETTRTEYPNGMRYLFRD